MAVCGCYMCRACATCLGAVWHPFWQAPQTALKVGVVRVHSASSLAFWFLHRHVLLQQALHAGVRGQKCRSVTAQLYTVACFMTKTARMLQLKLPASRAQPLDARMEGLASSQYKSAGTTSCCTVLLT